jgi:hypothetical protein
MSTPVRLLSAAEQIFDSLNRIPVIGSQRRIDDRKVPVQIPVSPSMTVSRFRQSRKRKVLNP